MHAPILMDMTKTCVSIISFPPAVQEIFNGKFITTFSALCKLSLNGTMGVLKIFYLIIHHRVGSGGSRNLERGVQGSGRSPKKPPKAVVSEG